MENNKLTGAGHRVKCPRCKRTNTYITTDQYTPDINPHGGMLKLRNPKHRGGLTFGSVRGSSSSIKMQFLECCDCGNPLCSGGRLVVVSDDYKPASELTQAEKNQARMVAEFPDSDEDVTFTTPKNSKTVCGAIQRVTEEDGPPGRRLTEKELDMVVVQGAEDPINDLTCSKCNRSDFKSVAGRKGHERHCKGNKD